MTIGLGVDMLRVMKLMWLLVAGVVSAQDALVERYCLGCHNERVKTAGLSLEKLSVAAHPGEWEKVARRLRARQMPPAGLPRPEESQYQQALEQLERRLDELPVDAGRTDTFRRLTRTEYRNAIRDLLRVDVDVSNLLPVDEASHGFDNMTLAQLSPTLVEKYLSAARKISRLAVGIPPRSAGGETVTLRPDLTQEEQFEGLPPGTRGGTVMKHTFPAEGEYEFVVRLARDRNEHVEGLRGEHTVEVLIDRERTKLFTVRPPERGGDHSQVDQHMRFRVRMTAGPHEVAVTFPKLPSLVLETERQPVEAHFNMDRHPRITPALYQLSIQGPFGVVGAGDTPSRRRIFVCRAGRAEEEEGCARKNLLGLARLAWRRPVTEEDVAGPLRLYRQARAQEGYEAAFEMGLRAVLVSPEFLLRVERAPAGEGNHRISDLELASRLSFFLWSSIPDEELLEAAERRQLRAPGVLAAQVKRMLRDGRSRALTENFAGQWLYLRNLDAVMPDFRSFVDFDDNLRQAMRRETELFFESVLREGRPLVGLLRADYTYLNERLARHYGIPHVYGGHFRRVALGPEQRRGGLLRQGSILTVTSYATRTSPVMRGKWVLDNILGIPPPPPPPNVPALKENAGTGQVMSLRERLAEHRRNPACSGCHQLMDPVGFALENYDAVGRWRESEDVAGGLPDGSRFAGVEGLEEAILARPEVFVTAFTEKLLGYALGRGIRPVDGAAVRRVVREARGAGYPLESIILGIVESQPFQMRRGT
ncbi:MAG: DUF1592 domain-containing protein [Acidobacteriota bacterium]